MVKHSDWVSIELTFYRAAETPCVSFLSEFSLSKKSREKCPTMSDLIQAFFRCERNISLLLTDRQSSQHTYFPFFISQKKDSFRNVNMFLALIIGSKNGQE